MRAQGLSGRLGLHVRKEMLESLHSLLLVTLAYSFLLGPTLITRYSAARTVPYHPLFATEPESRLHLLQSCSPVYQLICSIVKKVKRLFDFWAALCYKNREG